MSDMNRQVHAIIEELDVDPRILLMKESSLIIAHPEDVVEALRLMEGGDPSRAITMLSMELKNVQRIKNILIDREGWMRNLRQGVTVEAVEQTPTGVKPEEIPIVTVEAVEQTPTGVKPAEIKESPAAKKMGIKNFLRAVFPDVGVELTQQWILDQGYTLSNLVTAVSDLKNPKYAGNGPEITLERIVKQGVVSYKRTK